MVSGWNLWVWLEYIGVFNTYRTARVTNYFYVERTHTHPILFTKDGNKWNVYVCGWRIDVARP